MREELFNEIKSIVDEKKLSMGEFLEILLNIYKLSEEVKKILNGKNGRRLKSLE
ncbi:MAG: hypothetical protein QXX41_07920 [Nitrososphaerota archaeon]